MSYIGSTPTTQSFIAGTDSFNGTGSQTNFTLSRLVNSVNDVQVVVNNVVQYPPNYSVSGNTLTISPAPSAGTDNVYVRYLSTTLQSITIPGGSTVVGGFNVTGKFGVGTSNPLANVQIGDGTSAVLGSTAPYAWVSARANSTGNNPTTPQELLKLSWQEGSQDLGSGEGCAINFAVSLIGDSGTFYNVAQIASFKENTTDTSRLSALTFSTSSDGIAAPTERMRLTSTGDFQFNSGYGSVATAFGCRAWVNFNGTGTVAIRASGNVSSITDNGTGDYTVNFTTAMPDTNYSAVASGNETLAAFGRIVSLPVSSVSASLIRLRTSTHVPALIDFLYVSVAIFR